MTAPNPMNPDPTPARRELAELCAPFFEDVSWVDRSDVVDPAQMPPSAQTLLAHGGHMTAILRMHYNGLITLNVVADETRDHHYRRRIKLTLDHPPQIVEVGVLRLNLDLMPPAARKAILEKRAPLGDILAGYGVMTKVEPRWFVRFPSNSPIVECFERRTGMEAFGRVATIHCDGEEAIELLEVVAISEPEARVTGLDRAGERSMTPR